MSLAAFPAGRSAPNPPLPASEPPVRTATIDRPSSNPEAMRVAQRKRYTKPPQRANMATQDTGGCYAYQSELRRGLGDRASPGRDFVSKRSQRRLASAF